MARSIDDSDTEDDFVVLGTPLPDLDPTEGTKKPTTVQDLTAKDKEGRRRFHGAFTGGYSAGYFNTVGSKEGFTPSTFVSSRNKKNEEADVNRPEDFMDDEDLEEHGIAPRKFATAGNFTSEERKRKLEDVAARLTQSSALDLGGTLTDLVLPEYLPIGIKLLKKMGWREGQGLGPRVKKKRSRRKDSKKGKGASGGKKIYGCAMPPSESESEDSDSFVPANMSDLTFAPSDITPISLHAKDDVKGLGYRGLDPSLALPGSHVNLFGNPVRGKGKTGMGIRGHAFGVGALEDDDADIYAQDSFSNYDLTMKEGDDEDGNFGWTAPRAHDKQKVPVSYVGKLLEGFCLSSKPLQPRKNFPPPKLPPNFKPRHWSRRRKKEEEDLNGRQNKMTAVDRGLMLGETPIMSSVFDLVGSQDKSRIECTKEAINMTRSLDTPTGNVPKSADGDKKAENSTAIASGTEKNPKSKFLSRFTEASDSTDSGDKPENSVTMNARTSLFKGSLSLQPFLKEPAKQARFDQYSTAVQQKVPDPYGQVSSSRLTEWEQARERDEFSRSIKLFRPMSAMMSSRFVHGAMLDDKNQDSKMEAGEEVADEVKASDMRMFGKLTREEFEWHPDKLLCKRFNVPNPYPGSDVVGLPTVKRDKFSVFNFLSFGDYRPKEPDTEPRSTEKDVPKKADRMDDKADSSLVRPEKKKATLSSIFKVLDDPDFHKPPTNSKSEEPLESTMGGGNDGMEEEPGDESEEPDVDLFRAIFKNSDSEDSEDEKSDRKEHDESMSGDEEKDENQEEKDDRDEDKHSVIPDKEHSKDFLNRNAEGGGPAGTAVTIFKPQKSDTDMDSAQRNSFSSTLQDSSVKSPITRRPGTRWGAGDVTKSVFSVLDEINQESHNAENSTDIKNEVSDSEYGPALPPPPTDKTLETYLMDSGGSLPLKEKDVKGKECESHRHHRHKEKHHKHKKDKKKKSKYKTKKERRHKKGKKSSKSRKSKPESTGSEADSEISDDHEANSSDVSDKELLNRFMQVSKVKFGKS